MVSRALCRGRTSRASTNLGLCPGEYYQNKSAVHHTPDIRKVMLMWKCLLPVCKEEPCEQARVCLWTEEHRAPFSNQGRGGWFPLFARPSHEVNNSLTNCPTTNMTFLGLRTVAARTLVPRPSAVLRIPEISEGPEKESGSFSLLSQGRGPTDFSTLRR